MHIPSLDEIKADIGLVKVAWTDAVALAHAYPKIKKEIDSGSSPLDALKTAAPEILPIVEQVANLILPGSGSAIELVAFGIAHSKPMSKDEMEQWFQRASRE